MMKPNDFCVNDVKFRCVWGSRTTWDALNEIQKERKEKIVFHGTVEERGEGSRYAFFRDDEQGINYLIPIQESGQQTQENEIFKSAVHCTNGNHIPERRGSRTEIQGKDRAVRSETAGKTGRGGT